MLVSYAIFGGQAPTGNVLCNVAKVGNFGLDAPVPLVLEQQGMVVEETGSQVSEVFATNAVEARWIKRDSPRVEATHEVVALHATIHDGSIALLGNALLCNFFIDPVRKAPCARLNLAKLDGGRGIVSHSLLEVVVEVGVVEEDVRVVVPPVEVALDGLDGLDHSVNLLVAGQDDKGGIGSRRRGIGLEAARDKDLVVLFADFPTRKPPSAVYKHKVSQRSDIPNGRRRASGHQYPAWRAGVPNKQHQDEHHHQHREDEDDAQRDGHGRVAAQTQRPLEEGQARREPLVLRALFVRRRQL